MKAARNTARRDRAGRTPGKAPASAAAMAAQEQQPIDATAAGSVSAETLRYRQQKREAQIGRRIEARLRLAAPPGAGPRAMADAMSTVLDEQFNEMFRPIWCGITGASDKEPLPCQACGAACNLGVAHILPAHDLASASVWRLCNICYEDSRDPDQERSFQSALRRRLDAKSGVQS